MNIGKLPPKLLARLLAQVPITDPRVLVGPKVGEDAALIDYGDRVLVAKSDPVTFATDLIGWYVVHVNANDIAVRGATPRWFMCSLLLPSSASRATVERIFRQIVDACRSLNVTLVGGHTEVTYNLDRPIAVGAMLGEVEKGKDVRTAGAQPGDAIILTKGIAVEGAALLAREAAATLRERGVSQRTIQQARRLLFQPGISVVPEARALCAAVPVHSMHDPTEGGLATGLWELAQAAGVGLEVEQSKITVLLHTQRLCHALGLNPLGLIASGSLLATVASKDAEAALAALRQAGIPAAVIGRVLHREEGLRMKTARGVRPLPTFRRDEVARFFSQK